MNSKIKIVACTLSKGQGNGIAAIDNLLWHSIDRSRFDLTYCYTPIQGDQNPPKDGYHVFVPLENRFERLQQLFAQADIIQFNGGMDPVACDAARCCGVPYLIEIMHQCESGQIMPNIDICVCVSEQVRKYQPFPASTVVINNGIDTRTFKPPRTSRPLNQFIILQVAGLRKKLHFRTENIAEDLLSIDPRIEIWIVGSGVPRKETHGGRVKFLGVRTDMPFLYQRADVMLLPSKNDAFGLSCIEAMACSCLPIVTADGGMREIVDHGITGWLLEKPEKDLAIQYVRDTLLLKDSGKVKEMQKAARQKAHRDFSSKGCIAHYEQLYSSLPIDRKRSNLNTNNNISVESIIIHTILQLNAHYTAEKIASFLEKSFSKETNNLQSYNKNIFKVYLEILKKQVFLLKNDVYKKIIMLNISKLNEFM